MWIMRGPGIPAGERIGDTPVLMEDVMPTLLDLLGFPQPQQLTGRSRIGCLQGGSCAGPEEWWAFAASNRRRVITGLAAYRWPFKLLWQANFNSLGSQSAQDVDMLNKCALKRQDTDSHAFQILQKSRLITKGVWVSQRAEELTRQTTHTPALKERLSADYQPRTASCSSSGRLRAEMPTIGSPRFSLISARMAGL